MNHEYVLYLLMAIVFITTIICVAALICKMVEWAEKKENGNED